MESLLPSQFARNASLGSIRLACAAGTQHATKPIVWTACCITDAFSFEGKGWRLREAASRIAKHSTTT